MATNTINSSSTNTAPFALPQNVDPNTLWSLTNESGAIDPFQFNPVYQGQNAYYPNEQSSPGYQSYGSDWTSLLTSISGMEQNASPSGQLPGQALNANSPYINDTSQLAGTELGGLETLVQSGKIPGAAGDAANALMTNQTQYNGKNWSNLTQYEQQQALQSLIDPLGVGSDAYTSTLQNEKQLDSQGDKAQNLDQIAGADINTIAQAYGIDPASPQAKNLADAYSLYVAQNDYRNTEEVGINRARNAGSAENIIGKIGQVLGYTAASAGPGLFVEAPAIAAGEAAEAGADAATAASAAEAASTSYDIYQTAQGLANAIPALSAGNPIGALTSGLNAVGSGFGGDIGSGFKDSVAAINLGKGISDNDLSAEVGGLSSLLQSGDKAAGSPVGGAISGLYNDITGNNDTALTSDFGVPPADNRGTFSADGITADATAFPNGFNGNSDSTIVPSNPTNVRQDNGGGGLGGAASGITQILQSLLGNGSPQGQTESFGTNTISTPVSSAQASNVPDAGSWTDRQYYDTIAAIKQKYAASGLSGSTQEQQEIQQALGQQTGQ